VSQRHVQVRDSVRQTQISKRSKRGMRATVLRMEGLQGLLLQLELDHRRHRQVRLSQRVVEAVTHGKFELPQKFSMDADGGNSIGSTRIINGSSCFWL
jgi:hypothetical protein